MHVVQFLRKLFMFLEFSKNRLAVMCDPPGDACSRPSLLGFLLRTAWRWRVAAMHVVFCWRKTQFFVFFRSRYRRALVLYHQAWAS